MKKHILGIVLVVMAICSVAYVYKIDVEVYSLQRAENIMEKSTIMHKAQETRQIEHVKTQNTKEVNNEVNEKLKTLTQKAGNISSFEVSMLYKSKCSSCHGVNGEGGVGSKIIGLSYEHLSKSLVDFKSGAKKNYVMYGLLQNLSDEELDTLAKEIALFEQKKDKVQ